jgi:methionyl-tRNA formyltransferase
MVIHNEGIIPNRTKSLKRKLRKVLRIGVPGAFIGMRMRRWYTDDVQRLLAIDDLEGACIAHGIPFHTTPSINSTYTVDLFTQANADLGISLGNGYIGSKVFGIPRHGMINIHHELLPDYQNAQSVIWQLYNMSSNTGYTIHRIDRHIDTGDILARGMVPIAFMDSLRATVAHTYASLLTASADGLVNLLRSFDDRLAHATPQGPGHKYTTPTLRQYLRINRNYRRMHRAARAQEA